MESEPQMPVSSGRVTNQSGRSGRASGMSRSATGVTARLRGQAVGVGRRGPRLGVDAEHERLHRLARSSASSRVKLRFVPQRKNGGRRCRMTTAGRKLPGTYCS